MQGNLVGKSITGKWNQHVYRVVRILGSGENGTVYLAEQNGRFVALKVGQNAAQLALEWERMQALGCGTFTLCPKVYELDDFELYGDGHPYYAMDYIAGMDLRQFVVRHGVVKLPDLLLQIAELLHSLHQNGYAFGDIKPENLLIDGLSGRPVLVDFGGVTPFGTVVKEFTEIYDRAFWGWGTRIADEQYDYFALALLGSFFYRPLSERGKERLRQAPPDERRAALRHYLLHAQPRHVMMQALGVVADGRANGYAGFCTALRQARDQSQVERSNDGRKWDKTDWGVFFSILVFATVLTSIWLSGGKPVLFVLQ